MTDIIIDLPDAALFYLLTEAASLEIAADLEHAYYFDRSEIFDNARREVARRLGLPILSFGLMMKLNDPKTQDKTIEYLLKFIDDTKIDYASYVVQEGNSELYPTALKYKRSRVALTFIMSIDFEEYDMEYLISDAMKYRNVDCVKYFLQIYSFIELMDIFEDDAGIENVKDIKWLIGQLDKVTPELINEFVHKNYKHLYRGSSFNNIEIFRELIQHLSKENLAIVYKQYVNSMEHNLYPERFTKDAKQWGKYILDFFMEASLLV